MIFVNLFITIYVHMFRIRIRRNKIPIKTNLDPQHRLFYFGSGFGKIKFRSIQIWIRHTDYFILYYHHTY